MAEGVADGRYRLEEVIGTGGMATVWRARDTQLERQVAVKQISDTLSHDEDFMARFRREAMIASSLQHPNLVRIFDFDPDAERPFIVMELIEGPTLAELLAEEAPLDPAALAEQLLAALDHIHSAGIVHRDVKPANILADGSGVFRLTDFGIARAADATRYTATGQVIGTLRYMAPEIQAGEPASPASDLYAAGIVLGEAGLSEAATAALRDPDPARRPESAAAAALLVLGSGQAGAGGDTELMPTEPLEAGGAAPVAAAPVAAGGRRRVGALLAVAGVAAVLIAAVALSGSDDPATTGSGQQREKTASESTTTAEPTTPTTTTTTETSTIPPPAPAAENPVGKEPPGKEEKDAKEPKPPKEEKPKKEPKEEKKK